MSSSAADPPGRAAPESGRTWAVPGYTEVRTLGGGGFGEVVLATHDASGTAVAIKYLHPDLLRDPEHTAMFRAEARTLAGLESPHVVRLYEYVEAAAGAAIVMELIEGVTLARLLEREGKTTPEAALVVLYGSLLGLAAAHARGVVHRDYKPANVLVDGQGASKLTDFGIAALAGDRPVPTGTLRYMPPEQFEGAKASPAADVYAATVTFYQCLAGRVPFDGQTADELYDKHRSAEVPLDEIPEPLRPVVARGMAKDPRYRPSDAGRLAAELRDAAASGYGEDWEDRGRSHLAEAALLLLALLWPSGAAPAAQGITTAKTPLTEPAKQSGAGHSQPGHSQPGHPEPGHSQLGHSQPGHSELGHPHPGQSQLGHPQPGHSQVGRPPQSHGVTQHQWHLQHLEHLEHLEHLRSLGREDSGGNGERSTGRRMLRRVRTHPVAAAVTAGAAVVVIAVVAAFASGGGGTPSPGGAPGAGGSAALAGTGTTGSGGSGSAANAGPSDCVGDSGDIVGTAAQPVGDASVALSLRQQLAACDGYPESLISVTCGDPQTLSDGLVEYTCQIQAQGEAAQLSSSDYPIEIDPTTGVWS